MTEITFGGSGLDRAAEVRGDIEPLLQEADFLTFWRGKPLISGVEELGLTRLKGDHPLFAHAVDAPILLGREEGRAVFAHDISSWQPPEPDPEAQGIFLDQSEQVHPAVSDARFADLRAIMTRLTARDAELAAMAKGLFGWHSSHGFCAKCGAASTLCKAGWERKCPACETLHFPRTDPVVIMLITHGNRCLLGRSPGWPEGMYSCLAGFIEPGETIEAAVRREVMEETGIRVGPVRYLISQPWVFPSSLMLGCLGEAQSEEIIIDPVEIEDARWVSREEMMQAMSGENPVLLPARKGAIARHLLELWLKDKS